MATQYIKQYDAIKLRWSAQVDLTEVTEVRFLMSTSTRPVEPVIDKLGNVDPIDSTVLEVVLETDETAVPGKYNVEFETTWSDGQVVTFPGKGYEKLVISADLGGILES